MTEIIPSQDDPLLTVGEVARIFSVEPYTVRTWLKTGKLAGTKLEHSWRIQRSEMIRFANQQHGGNSGNKSD